MKITDFSQPIRQSSKGIIIIFAFNAYKFFKRFFVLFIAFGVSLARKKTFASLTPQTIILIIIGVLIIILIIAILKYLNFKFYLSNDDFHLSTGILNKDNTIIPKSKIQNVYIKQNFLQQIINVVSLNIETAGDEKSEIEIKALDKATALLLKEELFTTSNIRSEEIETNANVRVFFKVSPKRLLLEGISQNHFRSFIIIASFVFGFYYEFKDYFRELKLKQRLEDFITIDGDNIVNFLIINTLFIIVAIIVSLFFSVVKTFITNYNLEVLEHNTKIEINKGLFNKLSLSLTPNRIQNLIIKTNRLKAYFGLYTLSVKQAMVQAKQQKNYKIVAMEKAQTKNLVLKIFKSYNEDVKAHKPKKYYKYILAYRALLLTCILNIPAFFLFGNKFWLINIVLVFTCFLYVTFKYRKAYYKIDEEYVTVGRGYIDTITEIFEIHKIQSIELKQNLFQKRKNIASLNIATASEETTIPYIDKTDAMLIYDYLLFKVESQDRDWM
nr:PH domain-containing protein [uncultured Psychroserpens sp.]